MSRLGSDMLKAGLATTGRIEHVCGLCLLCTKERDYGLAPPLPETGLSRKGHFPDNDKQAGPFFETCSFCPGRMTTWLSNR